MKSVKKTLEIEEKSINEEFQRLEQIKQNLQKQIGDIMSQQILLQGRAQEIEKLKEMYD